MKKNEVPTETTWPESSPLEGRPSLFNMLMEGRAFVEWGAGWMLRGWQTSKSIRPNEPVLLLPGMLTDSWAIYPLRQPLIDAGYDVIGWTEGLNTGPQADTMSRLSALIQKEYKARGRPIHLVGWSLGGAMALGLAQENPKAVASVVAMGSPLRVESRTSHLNEVFEWISGLSLSDRELHKRMARLPDCPVTALVSKTDGVVSWRSSCAPWGDLSETIRVNPVSHMGMPANPLICWIVLDRLAVAQHKQWKPFRAKGILVHLTHVHAKQKRPVKKAATIKVIEKIVKPKKKI